MRWKRLFIGLAPVLSALICLDDAAATDVHTPSSSRQFPSYDYGEAIHDIINKRASTTVSIYVTTGAQGGTYTNGFPPIRQEIRDLQDNEDLWTLYILGLDMLQYTDQSQMLSWYQIAGIHGRPYLPFDGVQAAPGDQNNGYCTHVSILFPTWHRPYLALYEQVLYGLVQEIATMYPSSTRQRYIDAAKNFRIPYWDWAKAPPAGQSVLPDSVGGSPGVNVDGPAGVQTIANPLFNYQFNPLNTTELPDAPFSTWQTTLRYPTSDSPSASSQNAQVGQMLDSSASSFRSRLYNLFTNYPNYTQFSNEAWIPSNNNQGYDSIESLHDQIHGLTGYGGHMSYIDYSAFDPIFFLHHANIDRCFALWQALYPNSWVTPQQSVYSTFTSSAGTTQTKTSSLQPFYQSTSGKFWTSDAARNTGTFAYTYPETSNITGGSSTANIQNNVKIAINALYGPSTSSSASSKARRSIQVEKEAKAIQSFPRRHLHPDFASEITRSISTTSYWEWILNIQVAKFALSGPFLIHVFIGSFSDTPSDWATDVNQVGTHAIFTPASVHNSNPTQLVSGTIPLTDRLEQDVEAGLLRSMNAVDVKPYLMKNLAWRVTKIDGTYVENINIPSLRTNVVSSLVTKMDVEDELPSWGPLTLELDFAASDNQSH